MTDVLIKRELLERVVKADASNGASSVDLVDGWKAMEQIRVILAAPRQPEGELKPFIFAHELLANGGGIWIGCDSEDDVKASYVEGDTGDEVVALCRLSDAQRTIADLREQRDRWCSWAKELGDTSDTLRQQLADEREHYTFATEKLFAAEAQRDRLAGLLLEVNDTMKAYFPGENPPAHSRLVERIDAALAEAEP